MAGNPKRNSFPNDYSKQSHRIKLHDALGDGDAETIRGWLDAGMDPNMIWGGSPLLCGALRQWDGGSEILDLLLERGADPNLGATPPLFRFTEGFRLSWLLQAGADPSRAWAPPGAKRPFRVEAWIRKEGLEDFGLDWMIQFNTFRFWRLKKAVRPSPEFTKAFAIFAVKRSKAASVYCGTPFDDIFGVPRKKLTNQAVVKAAIASWLDRNFDAIDHLARFSDKSLILRFRRSDGAWLDSQVSVELDMGESEEATLEAFKAERLRAELDKSIKKPVKKTGLGGRKPSSGIL